MTVSAEVADWAREKPRRPWDPGRKLIRAIRKYQSADASKGALRYFRKKYWALNHRFWSVITQCEIDLNCQIGGGLALPHPQGIIIHPKSTIGVNCMIFQQVTLAGPVNLGGHVDVGTGAKLLGPLDVGPHARIGANAVVTRNVPDGVTVVGIPARDLNELEVKK